MNEAENKKTNADVIRGMTDRELNVFLWWYQIDVISKFMKSGGAELKNAEQIGEWLSTDDRTEITRLMRMGDDMPDSN